MEKISITTMTRRQAATTWIVFRTSPHTSAAALAIERSAASIDPENRPVAPLP
jgi:hypothetical protein